MRAVAGALSRSYHYFVVVLLQLVACFALTHGLIAGVCLTTSPSTKLCAACLVSRCSRQFQKYARAKEILVADPKYNGFPHWSKVEVGDYGLDEQAMAVEDTADADADAVAQLEKEDRLVEMQKRYAARFPAEAFEQVRLSCHALVGG